MTSQPPVRLRASDLVVRRGDVEVLHGVSLSAPAGEVTGLLGANGAGKTTLLGALAGAFPITSGAVTVIRTPESPSEPQPPGWIGYAPQEASLYPPLTAKENLRVFARYAGVPRRHRAEAVEEALDFGGLSDRADERVANLSVGLRRRLSLAVATLGDPAVVLLDEPTAGVDPNARIAMLATIADFAHRRRAAVVLSSHRLEDLEATCSRVVVIDHGRVIKAGPADRVRGVAPATVSFRHPGDAACVERLARRLCITEADGRVIIEASDPAAAVLEAARVVHAAGRRLRRLRIEEPSLEAAFARLVSSSDSGVTP